VSRLSARSLRDQRDDALSDDTFFEKYFRALDGADPHAALEMVSDDLEFAILFSTGTDSRSRQFLGGVDELRAFTDAGDMDGWAHHILSSSRTGDVEVVLGETRTDAGEVLGTFVCAAELDGDGRMRRYLVGRSPGIRFSAPD
jgi:hypothetical protein